MTTFEDIPKDLKCLMVSYMDLAIAANIYYLYDFQLSEAEYKMQCLENNDYKIFCRICYDNFPKQVCLYCYAVTTLGYPLEYNEHKLNDYKTLNEFNEYCRLFDIDSIYDVPLYYIFQQQCMGYYESFDDFLNEKDKRYRDIDILYKSHIDLSAVWDNWWSIHCYRSCEGEDDAYYGYGYYFAKSL